MVSLRARVAISLVLTSLALLLAPTTSHAFVSYYNCVLKPAWQWCDGRANGSYDGQHSWDYNRGEYPGPWDGTVTACQRVWKPSSGNELAGASCRANYTWNYYGDVQCICYEAEVRQISGGPHSINGYADADF
jgi:hypothetical protein